MRISLAASLFCALGLIHPVWTSLSVPPEDLETSGNDLDGSGSGSGDGPEQGEIEMIKDQHSSKDDRILAAEREEGNKNAFRGSSGTTFGDTHWPEVDNDSEYVIISNSKSYWEDNEIIGGIIAGGLTGFALAAAVAGMLIYKWQKKDEDGYILGKEKSLFN